VENNAKGCVLMVGYTLDAWFSLVYLTAHYQLHWFYYIPLAIATQLLLGPETCNTDYFLNLVDHIIEMYYNSGTFAHN
jgi:hypothetical protein